ncbi:Uncharacterised protein [Vibrio cholerae]|nr:Uncharacterised protein [Vibrio cholerae]
MSLIAFDELCLFSATHTLRLDRQCQKSLGSSNAHCSQRERGLIWMVVPHRISQKQRGLQ